jgi:hypothetical protein
MTVSYLYKKINQTVIDFQYFNRNNQLINFH